MKEIEININDKPVFVKKLGLRKFAELLETLESVPALLDEIQKTGTDDLIKAIPALLKKSLPDVMKVIKIATDLSDEEIEELGPADVVLIAESFFELNKFSVIYERVKKITARPSNPAKPTSIPSSTTQ